MNETAETLEAERPVPVVGLKRAAEILGMKRSNVEKFLSNPSRRIAPYAVRDPESNSGKLWRLEDVERARAEREKDTKKLEADERRRLAALGRPVRRPVPVRAAPRIVVGETQRLLLAELADGPVSSGSTGGQSRRLALTRLADRGLVRSLGDRPRRYELTEAGRVALRSLNESEG